MAQTSRPTTPSEPSTDSREISFAGVLERVTPTLARLERHGVPPMIGSHAWLALPCGDPLFVAAVWRAAAMWALRLDELQDDAIETSKMIAAERDWALVARRLRDRTEATRSGIYVSQVIA